MAPLALNCPLCCNETFPSHVSLKYHLLSMIDNLFCPSCNERCDDLMDLADHLGRECTNLPKEKEPFPYPLVQYGENVDQPSEEATHNNLIQEKDIKREAGEEATENLNYNTEFDNEITENGNEEENAEDPSTLLYTCQMCNMSFNSVKEHLALYHEGEEVVLEGNEGNGEQVLVYEGEHENMEVDNTDDLETSQSQNNESISEESTTNLDEPETSNPITTKYIVENGNVRKISEEEASETADLSSIIEVHCCSNCKLQFPNLNHFVKETLSYQCTFCQAIYASLIALNDHMKAHLVHDETGLVQKKKITMSLHVCEVCNTKFPSFKQLRLHSRMHDPVKTKKVDPPVSYNIMGEGKNENQENAEREVFHCPVCNKIYDKEYETVHLKSHAVQQINICYVCNRRFENKDNLEMHMKAHTGTKKFACSYCKKPFTNYDALEYHVVNQCHKRQYECQYCGRRFARPHEKVKHERIHTGEKPHVCQICGKSFRVSYCLTLHMRTHSGNRPYSCQHCGKRFKSHSVYNHHLLTHSDERNYKCPFCAKAFKTAVQLAGHKNSHTKPFLCKECNRPFASLYAVRAHMETHKRDNNLRFDCYICGASYARSFALRDHMLSSHGENSTEVQQGDSIVEKVEQQEEYTVHYEQEVEQQEVELIEHEEETEHVMEDDAQCKVVSSNTEGEDYVVLHMDNEVQQQDVSVSTE
ncbi:zinc finger protein 2-like [Sitophilus oryzae]|uniref:Zinc finger protein 2-like n=1 Tax=Sitophilus oryzae TaxID=7048 RepID=A0A6J2Y7K2_SITOR|nr:zinc finger protein 2-like [Sitophilus oryzae]